MTSISGIPASSLQQVKPAIGPRSSDADVRKMHEFAKSLEMSPAERAAQIAKQDAVEAHTVYKANGKIVGVHYYNNTTLYTSNAVGANAYQALKEETDLGLKGEALSDFLAGKAEEALRQKYGASLTVTHYDAGNAPTAGELHSQIFGNPSKAASVASPNAKVNLDPETLEMLSRIQEAQEIRAEKHKNWLAEKGWLDLLE